jgi:hypothetical protein
MPHESDTPTPAIPEGVRSDGPIRFRGSPSEVCIQLTAAIQGLSEALNSFGLKAQNPADSIGSEAGASTYHPGSARHEWLWNRWDALIQFTTSALAEYDESTSVEFGDRPCTPWVLTRFRSHYGGGGGGWRVLTADEATDRLGCSSKTIARHRKSCDELIDGLLQDREWKL